jgi:hypothetical protein
MMKRAAAVFLFLSVSVRLNDGVCGGSGRGVMRQWQGSDEAVMRQWQGSDEAVMRQWQGSDEAVAVEQ